MRVSPLAKILFVYLLLSLLTFMNWERKDANYVTGDEPHYLVMANGLVKYGALEQTEIYKEEFASKKIFRYGLAPAGSELTPANSHTVSGPNGIFNAHNIGLPILLGIPFLLGGTLGAKLFMIFSSAIIIILGWKFSGLFSKNEKHRFWTVFAVGIAMPFISGSSQVYPDMMAGLISLTGLYWFITSQQKRSSIHELLLAIAIVFLPWLQVKFAASCMLLVIAIASKIYLESKDVPRILRLMFVAGVSCILLATYNYYAFGKISGPYQSGALEISKTSLMVLFGLHFDQNQGFLLQNPLNLIGILAIAWLYRFNRQFAVLWGLVFLSLIVPNALHPNWYGGWSFSGRFAWAATIVFVVPTIYGLIRFAEVKEKLFRIVVGLSMLLQLSFFYFYAARCINSYNKAVDTWFDSYSIYYLPIKSWLPMLYDSKWAFSYTPNYVWLSIITVLFMMGFLQKRKLLAISMYASIIFSASIAVGGVFNNYPKNEILYHANDLPSDSGRVAGTERYAEQGIDHPGFLTYGPFLNLGKGEYEIVIQYSSPGTAKQSVGWLDVYDATTGKQNSLVPLYGTEGNIKELKLEFTSKFWRPHTYEFRNQWDGISNLKIQTIHLRRI
ncbi:hypothetical protein ACO0LF_21265 [Undibacterium sp. Di27W]|uniref:hypothetical protein n=1 Tax=Undibacterium sp. Di27W TaxID=3413036 RepID=UPI003BF36A99